MLITIAVPTFNESAFLEETLHSIQVQTFSNFSVVVYDNCSTDETFDIARKFSKQDERFQVKKNSSNIGLLNNFRKSLNEAESEYFMWMGAHDLIERNYLLKLEGEHKNNSHIALSIPIIKYLEPSGKISQEVFYKEKANDCTPIVNYLNSIGEGRKATAQMHGLFRLQCIKGFGEFDWNTGAYDLALLSRAEFFGTVQNQETAYIRRLWSDVKLQTHKKSGVSIRLFSPDNKQYGLKRLTFIPLYQIYINDFLRLPLGTLLKIKYLPKLVYLITKKFEINLLSNLLIYFASTLTSTFHKKFSFSQK